MIITGIQAKAADRYAIDVLRIPSLVLMERASAFAAEEVLASGIREGILILCGTGNNGADGVCAGRILREKGLEPRVVICGNLERASWEFLRQLSDFRAAGGIPSYIHSEEDIPPLFDGTKLLLDAAFGIGLKRPLTGLWAQVISAADRLDALRIAVDVPSGVSADTGEIMGACIRADKTVTFGKMKTGLMTGSGRTAAGEVLVCDIGIPEAAYKAACETGV